MAKKRTFKPRKLAQPARRGGANSAHFIVGGAVGAAVGRAIGGRVAARKVSVNVPAGQKVRIMKEAIKRTPMREVKGEMVANKRAARNAKYISNEQIAAAAQSYSGTRFQTQENNNARRMAERGLRAEKASKSYASAAEKNAYDLSRAKANARQLAKNDIMAVQMGKTRLRAEKFRAGSRRGGLAGLAAGLAAGWLAGEVMKKRK